MSKSLIFRLSGAPNPGSIVTISYCDPRGGRTDAKHEVTELDTLETISAGLAAEIASGWPPEGFGAKARGASILLNCQDCVQQVTFSTQIDGNEGGLAIEQEAWD